MPKISRENLLVDSHAHLDMLQEKGLDIDEVIKRACNNQVNIIQSICTSIKDFPNILKIAEKYDGVYASIGLHPENIKTEPLVTTEEIVEYTKHPKVIGIGEVGLDYHYEGFDKKLQKKNFENHIEASRRTQLPLIIHTRDADKDTEEILISEMKNGEFPFLLHCYTSGRELALKGLELGGYISFSGIVTFKNAKNLQDLAYELPLNKLMVETDCPFLAPTPHRGETNEPSFVIHTAEYLAELKNIKYSLLRETTTNNFLTLFNKIDI